MKKLFSKCSLVLMLVFVVFTFVGCETFLEILTGISDGLSGTSSSSSSSSSSDYDSDSNSSSNNDSTTDFSGYFSNEYSSKSNSGLVYDLYNYSSYTVTLTDASGSITLSPGNAWVARFDKEFSIYSLYYSPSDKVKVSQSGTTITFRDR